ncbi:MAG: PilZ domain-containing protein [Desulfobulbaceae bacterium]|nr:PilZ domain-containing protein [Desulfobulbaceae bacterium]MDY0350070.1 PilZ domain-containing protein [Desulfobulbaceae bacterium]
MKIQGNCRSTDRHQTLGMMTNLFDGEATVLGVVEDVSLGGMCVSNIPASFEDKTEVCLSIVTGPRRDFHLALQPRWVQTTNRGMYKIIGFSIQDPPSDWKKFIETLVEGQADRDPFYAMVTPTDTEM